MERILMFLGLFIAGIIIGLGFCVGSLYIYKSFKIGYYDLGIAVLFYFGVAFVLLIL